MKLEIEIGFGELRISVSIPITALLNEYIQNRKCDWFDVCVSETNEVDIGF